MSYTGTILTDLQSIVEVCLQRNSRICAICRQIYGDHSLIGGYCPDSGSEGPAYLQTSFTEPR